MKKYSSTTKASSHRTSRSKRLRSIALIGFVCLAILFLASRLAGAASSFIFAPISHIETWFADSAGVLPSYVRDRSDLIAEIDTLKRKVASESATTNSIARLQNENIALRNMLGDTTDQRVVASVIGRPSVTPYDVLVLDKGSEAGIVQYAPVYAGFDTAIGYVTEVFRDTSIVALASTPGFESTVYIFGPNIYTTAKGIGGGVLRVSVPQGITLSINDLVAVPSFDSGVYGTIDVIDSIPTEPEQHGYVTLDTPIQSIRFVSVGTSPLKALSFDEVVAVVERTKKDLAKVPVPSGVLVDLESATGTATATATTTIPESEIEE